MIIIYILKGSVEAGEKEDLVKIPAFVLAKIMPSCRASMKSEPLPDHTPSPQQRASRRTGIYFIS
jgi:hypothetical protein